MKDTFLYHLCSQLVLLTIIASIQAEWFTRKNVHYYFANVQVKWADAQKDCQQRGANLVTALNEREMSFILKRNPSSDDPKLGMTSHWIGLKGFCLYQGFDPCTWEWVDGAEVDPESFPWQLGYPNTEYQMTFAYIDHTSGKWKNGQGDEYRGYICEVPDPCEQTDNPCAPLPCESDREGHYTCVEQTNSTLSQEYTPCAHKPCQHGKCRELGEDFECECHVGFTGDLCDLDIDECQTNIAIIMDKKKQSKQESICVNGACRNRIGGFDCDCLPGYHGELCAMDIDECQSPYACNYGNCTNTVGSYYCTCWEGYVGDACDYFEEDSNSEPPRLSQNKIPITSSGSTSGLPLVPVFGGVIGALIVIVVVIIVIIFVLKRKRRSSDGPTKSNDKDTSQSNQNEYTQVPQKDPKV